MVEMKNKYDARYQLKQLGWTDTELDAIGLTLHDEGDNSKFPERPWLSNEEILKTVIPSPTWMNHDSPYHY